jgi:hypothetical protein
MSVPTLLQATVQNVTFTGTAGISTALAANEAPGRTCTVRLCSTSDCYYLATVAGTAATANNGSLLAAGNIEYLRVGNLTFISVVQASAGGSLNITQMADVSTPS